MLRTELYAVRAVERTEDALAERETGFFRSSVKAFRSACASVRSRPRARPPVPINPSVVIPCPARGNREGNVSPRSAANCRIAWEAAEKAEARRSASSRFSASTCCSRETPCSSISTAKEARNSWSATMHHLPCSFFILPPYPDQLRDIQQVVQGIGPVPELMLAPVPRRHRQEQELVNIRAA